MEYSLVLMKQFIRETTVKNTKKEESKYYTEL